MVKKLYRIEHTHEVTEVYLVEAESAEKAEEMLLHDDVKNLVDSEDSEDIGTYEISEANNVVHHLYEAQESYNDEDEDDEEMFVEDCECYINEFSDQSFVDLGLSVKWATCNLGASRPEESGDYFAWGETAPKKDYSWKEYKFGKEAPFSKYQPKTEVIVKHLFKANEHITKGDNKTQLDKSDDAAAVLLGGNWRMPTIDDFKELVLNCNWTTAYMNGVKGFKVRSLVSGYTYNWIFLPHCGFNIDKDEVHSTMTSYATSSLDKKDARFAMHLSININWCNPGQVLSNLELSKSSGIRCSGHVIRPVCK